MKKLNQGLNKNARGRVNCIAVRAFAGAINQPQIQRMVANASVSADEQEAPYPPDGLRAPSQLPFGLRRRDFSLMRLESRTMQEAIGCGRAARDCCAPISAALLSAPSVSPPAAGACLRSAMGRPCDSIAVGARNGSGHSRVVSAVGIKWMALVRSRDRS